MHNAGDHDKVLELNRDVKRRARADRKAYVANQFKDDPQGDPRRKKLWKVVSDLRTDYKPAYVQMKDSDGRLVPLKNRADAIASYLETKRWVNPIGVSPLTYHDPIGEPLQCAEAPFTIEELAAGLKTMKVGKQPGPDMIVMELYKWLDPRNRCRLLTLLNYWWSQNEIHEEVLCARLVPIYKQGSPDEAANYRPILLLNSIYKIYVTLIRIRVQTAVESKISPTQYGFRPNRSTAHAAYVVRRVQDWSEQKKANLHLTLFNFQKAFDKVQPKKLQEAMVRLGFTSKFVKVVEDIYAKPTFYVQNQYGKSSTKKQTTGIRQGCPLSPC